MAFRNGECQDSPGLGSFAVTFPQLGKLRCTYKHGESWSRVDEQLFQTAQFINRFACIVRGGSITRINRWETLWAHEIGEVFETIVGQARNGVWRKNRRLAGTVPAISKLIQFSVKSIPDIKPRSNRAVGFVAAERFTRDSNLPPRKLSAADYREKRVAIVRTGSHLDRSLLAKWLTILSYRAPARSAMKLVAFPSCRVRGGDCYGKFYAETLPFFGRTRAVLRRGNAETSRPGRALRLQFGSTWE